MQIQKVFCFVLATKEIEKEEFLFMIFIIIAFKSWVNSNSTSRGKLRSLTCRRDLLIQFSIQRIFDAFWCVLINLF